MPIRLSPTSSLTSNIYLTSDSPYLYSPSPYIPSQATVELYPSLPSYTTDTPTWIAPGVVVPGYTTIQPRFPLVPELDLDNDESAKNKIAEYFYYKTLDKWLFDDMLKVLNYLKVSGNSVDVIDKISDYDKNSTNRDTQESIEKKIKFIEQNILNRNTMYDILRRYTRETSTKWAELVNKHEVYVKDIIKKSLRRKLEKIIEGKMRK